MKKWLQENKKLFSGILVVLATVSCLGFWWLNDGEKLNPPKTPTKLIEELLDSDLKGGIL